MSEEFKNSGNLGLSQEGLSSFLRNCPGFENKNLTNKWPYQGEQ
jgi:hypothetical protein